MRLANIIWTFSIVILSSCIGRNMDNNVISENVNNYFQSFSQQNINKIEMIYSIEYYKEKIIEYQDNFYGGFSNISMEMTDLMNISSIIKVDDIIPRLLTFIVSWTNMKGNIYYLYTFDENQMLVNAYFLGQIMLLNNQKQILMEKLTGNIIENEIISIGDFNNDGVNEITIYTEYRYIRYVFIVYGYNIIENSLEELCLVPVLINHYNVFPTVEYIGNGFRILEVIDDELLEYVWNNYIWDSEKRKYIRQ